MRLRRSSHIPMMGFPMNSTRQWRRVMYCQVYLHRAFPFIWRLMRLTPGSSFKMSMQMRVRYFYHVLRQLCAALPSFIHPWSCYLFSWGATLGIERILSLCFGCPPWLFTSWSDSHFCMLKIFICALVRLGDDQLRLRFFAPSVWVFCLDFVSIQRTLPISLFRLFCLMT